MFSHRDGQAFEAAGRAGWWVGLLRCETRSSRTEYIAQMSPHSAAFHLRGAGRVALSGKIRFLSEHLADGPKGGPLPPIRKREQIGRASCRERVCQYV